MKDEDYFVSAVRLDNHPLKNIKRKLREEYYLALEYLVVRNVCSAHVRCRLQLYKELLTEGSTGTDGERAYKRMMRDGFLPWKRQNSGFLLCDIALVLLEEGLVRNTADRMMADAPARQKKQLQEIVRMLLGEVEVGNQFQQYADQISQYRQNVRFLSEPECRVIVTANISAGKSTLINAILGQGIARMAWDICTGNLYYYYNKPFADGRIHRNADALTYSLPSGEIRQTESETSVAFSLPFFHSQSKNRRLCLIDTPGVNASMWKEHGNIARQCITNEKYDYVICILNANKIGTDEEAAHVKWVLQNVPKEKLIFVLNKLDDFRSSEDNIEASVEKVKADLCALGYDGGEVYPMSAYYAYLIKKKLYGWEMSEDERDDLALLEKKFCKTEYNLSRYHESMVTDGSLDGGLRKSGFYYLEKKIYGGAL